MKCEACGGDGLIEVGAYRGEKTDETRECRLCGGVITNATPEWKSYGSQAAARTGTLTLKESTSGVRRTAITVEDAQEYWARQTAREYDERLRRENERRQQQAEIERYENTIRSTDAIMNEFLRDKFGD